MHEVVRVWGALSPSDWEMVRRHVCRLMLSVWKWEYTHLRVVFEGYAAVCVRITYDSWEMVLMSRTPPKAFVLRGNALTTIVDTALTPAVLEELPDDTQARFFTLALLLKR